MAGVVQRLPALVGASHHALVLLQPLLRVRNSREVIPVAELHRTLQAHPAKLARRPGHGEVRHLVRTAGHRDRAQAVRLAQHDREKRYAQVRADQEHPARMAHERRLLDLRPHHDSWRVAEEEDGQVERVAELHEARRFVRRIRIDRPAEVRRVVRDDSHRPPFDPHKRGHRAEPKPHPQLQHRIRVGQRLDYLADVVHAQAVLRDDSPHHSLVTRFPFRKLPLEVRQVLLRDHHGRGLVLHEQINNATRNLHVHGANVLGGEHAEPAAFDHRRTAHADVRTLGRDDYVATTEERGVSGKAAPGCYPHHRHEPTELGEAREGCRGAAAATTIGVTGPPATAFREQDHRHPPAFGNADHAVRFAVVLLPLRARKHGVVIRHDGAARLRVAEQLAVDAAHAGDHAIRRAPFDEILLGPSLTLRRQDERAVLHERAVVHEVEHVFACCALSRAPPPLDRFGPCLVLGPRPPPQHKGKVRANVVEVERLLRLHVRTGCRGLFDEQQRVTLVDRVAHGHANPPHDASSNRSYLVLHLHGFHDHEGLPCPNRVAFGHRDRDDRPLQWGRQDNGAIRARGCRAPFASGLLRHHRRLAEGEHGQWVLRIDGRPCPLRRCHRRGSVGFDKSPALALRRRGDEFSRVVVDEARVHPARKDLLVPEQGREERDVRLNTGDPELAQRTLRLRHRLREHTTIRMPDDLREQ